MGGSWEWAAKPLDGSPETVTTERQLVNDPGLRKRAGLYSRLRDTAPETSGDGDALSCRKIANYIAHDDQNHRRNEVNRHHINLVDDEQHDAECH